MLLNQVFADGVRLFLGEDFGQVLIVARVGERGDHNLRGRPNVLFAPSPNLVEAGSSQPGQDGASWFEEIVGMKSTAFSLGAWLKQNTLPIQVKARCSK